MLMLAAANPAPVVARELPNALFNEDERWRLICVHATAAAELHLVPLDHPCPDHQACRRFAFARLRVAARLAESPQP